LSALAQPRLTEVGQPYLMPESYPSHPCLAFVLR
jgi:hypothetical protein